MAEQENGRLRLVLDTNVFVAAGFNPRSHSAEIIRRVRSGEWRVVWNEETRWEICRVLNQIPPLSRKECADIFREEGWFTGTTYPDRLAFIEDPDDRKFAALAAASEAALVTNDDHLLSKRAELAKLSEVRVMTPAELVQNAEKEEI